MRVFREHAAVLVAALSICSQAGFDAAAAESSAADQGGWRSSAWPKMSFDQADGASDPTASVGRPSAWWTVKSVSSDFVQVFYFAGTGNDRKRVDLRVPRKDIVLWDDFKPLPKGSCWVASQFVVEQGDWQGVIRISTHGRGVWSDLPYPFEPQVDIPVEVLVADQWFVIRPSGESRDLLVGASPVVVGGLRASRSGRLWGFENGGIEQAPERALIGCDMRVGPATQSPLGSAGQTGPGNDNGDGYRISREIGLLLESPYAEARKRLMDLSWRPDISWGTSGVGQEPAFKAFPEVLCGHGWDAICTARLSRAGLDILVTVDQKDPDLRVVHVARDDGSSQ